MVGEALGNYRLVAKLGSGSMGVVFLAEHQRVVRQVAIKLLAPELVRSQHVLERFFNEARAASSIRHPGIIDVFDCDVDASGRAYMVMEHLEGETLANRLRQTGPLHWTAACLIAGQVADALGAVHDKRIIHRDLKPDNVFLVGNPRAPAAAVKVLDFGVAKLQAVDRAVRLTMRGSVLGTPEYMSPEQCAASENVDYRADIYALGCILFEMLNGQPPFVAATLRELMVAHRYSPAPSPSVDIPDWLRELLARMLSKEPAQRPSSMHDVSKVLRKRKAPGFVTAPAGAVRAVVERVQRRDVVQPITDRHAVPFRRREVRNAAIAISLAAAWVLTGAVWAVRRNSGFDQASPRSRQTVVATAKSPPRPASTANRRGAAETVSTVPPQLPVAARTLPTTVPLPRPRAAVDPLPPERRPERARPGRALPMPTRQPRGPVVDSDGIVAL